MKYVFLHHSASSTPGLQLNEINAYHKSKGFTKSTLSFYVGYNFVLDRNFQVTQTRSEFEEGCHTVTPKFPDANKNGIGICMAGDFTKEIPSPALLNLLAPLLADIQVRHRIPESEVWLHREVENMPGGTYTECCGQDFRSLTKALRKTWLQNKINSLRELIVKTNQPRTSTVQVYLDSCIWLLAQL